MGKLKGTIGLIIVFLIVMVIGQIAAVSLGIALDRVSKTVALATFIPLHYAMYWVAWRVALYVADTEPEPATTSVAA